ncbi:MAG TPA: hypothetical protein VIQ51_03550 [Chryseosolibacter sp.]
MNRKHRINYQQVAELTGLPAGAMNIHSTEQTVVTGLALKGISF